MKRLFGLIVVFGLMMGLVIWDQYYHQPRHLLEGRSPQWSKVEKLHLEKEPCCAACGKDKELNVHHIKPFHIYPDLELEPTNLITLCQRHHLDLGHLGNYQLWNEHVREDAVKYKARLDEAKENAKRHKN